MPSRTRLLAAALALTGLATLGPVTPSAQALAVSPAAVERAHTSQAQGVAVWQMDHATTALRRSGARWYYTWSTRHDDVRTPRGVEFVPMMWGSGSLTAEGLADVRRSTSPWLLGFNEPDLESQANLDVEEALRLWPRLQRTGKKLVSPAVAWGGADAGGWLDRFMAGVRERGLRVDAIALHWYGGDHDPRRATDQLEAYLRAVHDRYGKPIWLTEHALIAFGQQPEYPSAAVQAEFLRRSQAMLDRLPFVRRSAWFGLPAAERGRSTGLFRPGPHGPVVTPVGRAFQQAAQH